MDLKNPEISSELIKNIKLGSVDAEEQLYHHLTSGQCKNWILKVTRNTSDAQDVFHDVFLESVKSIKTQTIEKPESLHYYIFSIIKVQLFRFLKRKMAYKKISDPEMNQFVLESVKCPSESPFSKACNNEFMNLLEKQILQIQNPIHREILIMTFLNGNDDQELMEKMQLNEHQVWNYKFRAKNQLIRMLKARGENFSPLGT